MSFQLYSTDIKDGDELPLAQVYNGLGHSGENISPHLAWKGEPAGTKSFVVTCFDPDAPTGSGWWHWLLIDIPGSVHELATGTGSKGGVLPSDAFHLRSDYSTYDFGGAAPPPGPAHRYIFTVYAMPSEHLEIDAEASAALVGYLTTQTALGKATLTATYTFKEPAAPSAT
jgi:Raf kinase inhibitor-like YbhB/YbcL family protein